MKYIITENKLEKVAIKYLNKMYGDLEEYKTDERPDSLFFVKGKKVYMEHDLKNGILWVDYDTIWEDLENTFSLDYNEIQLVISKWVEDTTKLRVVSPMSAFAALAFGWKRLIV